MLIYSVLIHIGATVYIDEQMNGTILGPTWATKDFLARNKDKLVMVVDMLRRGRNTN